MVTSSAVVVPIATEVSSSLVGCLGSEDGRDMEARQGKVALPLISFSWREFKPEKKKLPPISHQLSNSRSAYFYHKSSSTRTIVPAFIPLQSSQHSTPSPVKFAYLRTQLRHSRHRDLSPSPQHEEITRLALSSTLHLNHLTVRKAEERRTKLRAAQSRSVLASPWG